MQKEKSFSIGKFIFSVIFNAVLLAVAVFVFKPFFEEIDDTQICMISEGLFGSREWHLIYANVILGRLYVMLGSLVPFIRWHVVLQYAFIFVGYVFGMYVLSKHKRGTFVAIVATLASFYELYVSLQYTKTASFVCVIGFVLLFERIRNIRYKTKENRMLLVIAYILIVYGVMLRPEGIFIAAVPTLSIGILEMLRNKNIKSYVLYFMPVLIIVILLKGVDTYTYNADAQWSYFMKYNRARMELNDYRYDILDFTKFSAELEALDVSENDALAILTYQYGDDSVLNYERLAEIRAPFPRREFGYSTFANLFENLVGEVFKSYILLLGLLGLIGVLIASIVTDRSKSSPGFIKDSRRKLFAMFGIGGCCAAAITYFQYSGRYNHRLIGAIVIPTLFVICYMIDSIFIKENDSKIVFGGNKNDITMPVCIALSIAVLGLNGLAYIYNFRAYEEWADKNIKIQREMDIMSKDTQSLYVGDTFTFQNVFKYSIFTCFEEGKLSNFVTCGSWYINSPVTKAVTRKYGYENPYDALRSGDDNVFLLDNGGVECKTLFLNEHYDNVYVAEKLGNRGGIDVYHIKVNE